MEQCRLQLCYVSTSMPHVMSLTLCTAAVDDEICNTIIKCSHSHLRSKEFITMHQPCMYSLLQEYNEHLALYG